MSLRLCTYRIHLLGIRTTWVFLHGRTTEVAPYLDRPPTVYSKAGIERLCGRCEGLGASLTSPNNTSVKVSRGIHQASSDGVVDQTGFLWFARPEGEIWDGLRQTLCCAYTPVYDGMASGRG
jgi:hypothetical protein